MERELIPALTHLRDALAAKAEAFDHVLKSGRTHLMDATPVRLGQQFGGYAHQLTKGIERVRAARPSSPSWPWVGPPWARGSTPHPEFAAKTIARVSEDLGLDFREAENHFEAQAAKDAVVNAAGTLNTIATSFFRLPTIYGGWPAGRPRASPRSISPPFSRGAPSCPGR